MSEERFELSEYSTAYRYSVIDNIQKGTLKANEIIILLSKQAKKIDEQQATLIVLEKNFEDLVNWSSEIAKRNVLLDEKIGKLQQENKELKNKLNKMFIKGGIQ